MESAPITTWDGAEAYYTWAGSSNLLALCLALTAAIVVAVVVQSLVHERKSFKRAEGL